MSVQYFRYTPTQILSELITRFSPVHVERNAWQLALRESAWEVELTCEERGLT